jgi:hypothetical protein
MAGWKRQKRWVCTGCGRHLGVIFHDPAQDKDMIRLMITPYDDPDDVANRHLIEAPLPAECNCACGTHNEVASLDDCNGQEI